MSNKVKFGLKNVYYAKITDNSGDFPTYADPVAIPGAVNLSMDAQSEINKFYADDIVYYQSASNNGYEGDLEIALLPDSFRKDILGETEDSKKVLVENVTVEPAPFALLFEFSGDKKAIRHVLYYCIATRPGITGATKEETIEPQTDTLSLSAAPLASGIIKAKSGADTDSATYSGWYSKVYEPTSAGA